MPHQPDRSIHPVGRREDDGRPWYDLSTIKRWQWTFGFLIAILSGVCGFSGRVIGGYMDMRDAVRQTAATTEIQRQTLETAKLHEKIVAEGIDQLLHNQEQGQSLLKGWEDSKNKEMYTLGTRIDEVATLAKTTNGLAVDTARRVTAIERKERP